MSVLLEECLATAAGRPGSGVVSVTVIGPDPERARDHAEAALALGLDGPAWTLGLDGYEAMTVLDHHVVLCTPGFPEPGDDC